MASREAEAIHEAHQRLRAAVNTDLEDVAYAILVAVVADVKRRSRRCSTSTPARTATTTVP